MGGKYEVRGAMSGLCPFWEGQFTNSLAHALWLLVRFSRKEPLDCAECVDEECPSRIRGKREWS